MYQANQRYSGRFRGDRACERNRRGREDLNVRRHSWEDMKEEVIRILNLENILHSCGENHIIFRFNGRRYIYTNNDKNFDTSLFYSEYPEEIRLTNKFSIQCYEVPNFIRKFPYSEKELYQFFKDIGEGMDRYFYERLSLQDIYYSVEDKKYVILAPYYNRLPEEVEICISNILKNKPVFTYKDTEIKTVRDLNNLGGDDELYD